MAAVKLEENILMELLDNLIREENRGHTYFKEAALVSKNADIKRLFERLSDEEQNHVEVLVKMRDTVSAETKKQAERKTIRMDGRFVNILDLSEMMMEQIDLPRPDLFQNQAFAELFKNISVRAVLEYAMKIEFENARYIKEFFQHIQSRKNREVLLRLIQEEKEHFLSLQKMLNNLV